MSGLAYDHSSEGFEGLLDALLHLKGKSLLHLEPVTEDIYDACDFAQAGNVAVGDVGDVHLSIKRQHVMFAQGEEIDVPDDDHLVVFLLKEGFSERLVWVLRVASGEDLHGFRNAEGCLLQSFALGILSQQGENALVMCCEFIESFAKLCLWIHVIDVLFGCIVGENVPRPCHFRMMQALL